MIFSWRAKYFFGILLVPFVFRALESINGPWPIPFKWPEEFASFDYDTRKRLFNEPERANVAAQTDSRIDVFSLCKGSPTCAPATVKMPRKIVSAPAAGVATCIVGGNFAAEAEAFTCLMERKRVIGNVRGMHPQDIDRYCGSTNKFKSVYDMSKNIRVRIRDMRKWTFVMVGRDPVERFVYGFTKHCILGSSNCYSCGTDIKCFADTYHYRLLQFAMYDEENYENVGDMDWDLFPQTWMCDIEEWQHRYQVLHLSRNITRLTQEFSDVFGEANNFAIRSIISAGEEREFLRIQDSYHYQQQMRKVLEDRTVMTLIGKMYYNDYRLLGYELKL